MPTTTTKDIPLEIPCGIFAIRYKIKIKGSILKFHLISPKGMTNPDDKVPIHLDYGSVHFSG
jgi:hypothetical protein